MKKERIVVICICAVLFGSLYAQGIAWTCHFAMPSTAQLFWPILFDAQFGRAEELRKTAALPDSIAAFVCSGWPPLGFLYGEARLLGQEIRDMRVLKDRIQKRSAPEARNRVQDRIIDASAAALKRK